MTGVRRDGPTCQEYFAGKSDAQSQHQVLIGLYLFMACICSMYLTFVKGYLLSAPVSGGMSVGHVSPAIPRTHSCAVISAVDDVFVLRHAARLVPLGTQQEAVGEQVLGHAHRSLGPVAPRNLVCCLSVCLLSFRLRVLTPFIH